MVYVKRDGEGRIVSVSLTHDAAHDEAAPPGDPAVTGFARAVMGEDPLADSDMRLVRVLEDVIDLLIGRVFDGERGAIFADLEPWLERALGGDSPGDEEAAEDGPNVPSVA